MQRALSTAAFVLSLCYVSANARAETVWVRADEARDISGPMVLGGKLGIVEEGAMGDFLVSTECVSPDSLSDGYAEYQVRIPAGGAWHVWARLRYPSGLAESFAWIPQGEKPTGALGRCLGHSGVGVRAWHWDSQGSGPGSGRLRAQLDAGVLTFRIYAREASQSVFSPGGWKMGRPTFHPRLNLLCLTDDPAYVPSDADAQKALKLQPAKVDPATIRVHPVSFPPVSEAELQRQGKKRVPDWLRCPRFFTKDSWRGELATRRPGDIAMLVRQIAANEGSAFRLSALWAGEAYYQSAVAPHAPGLGSLDYLQEALDEGRRTGVAIVMYVNPNALYRGHPLFDEAAVRRADGRPSETPAYAIADTRYVCVNHPKYREFLVKTLEEAFTKYRPAGLYVDGLTPHRCFCEHCRAKYEATWSRPMPVEKLARGPDWCVLWEMVNRPELVGDPGDPDTPRYTQFLAQTLADCTRLVSETVKRRRPDAVTLFHSWPKPQTLGWYDGTLTEIYLAAPWKHPLWKFGELANYSNAFPVPVLFNIYLHDHGTEAEARAKMVQGLANGCYPNCWNLLGMRPMFRFMRENAETLDFLRSRPVRFLAYPRGVAHDAAQRRVAAADREGRPIRDRFLAPYVGLYSAMVRQGLPVVTLGRSDFHQHLDGFRVLCLANEACMSDEQIAAVRRFVAEGGGLLATGETSRYDEKGSPRADLGLADVFGVRLEGTLRAGARRIRTEVRAAGPPGPAQPPSSALPDLAAILSGRSLEHDEPHAVVRLTGGTSLADLTGGEPEGAPLPAVVVHGYGAGRVVYVPGRLDAIQCDRLDSAVERLFAEAIRWAAGGEAPVQVTAPAPVAATLFEQPGRRILHLVNLQGDSRYKSDQIAPIGGVRVRLQAPPGCRVTRLRRLWDRAEVAFERSGDRIALDLDRLGEYEVLVAEVEPGRP